MSARYFLDQDGDGHWYLVPVDRKADWEMWPRSACGWSTRSGS